MKIKAYVLETSSSMAVDPDPHGSAFIFPPGSGSAFNMRILFRIQESKIKGEKTEKCKEISTGENWYLFLKLIRKFGPAPLFSFYF